MEVAILQQELYHYGTPRHSGRYPWGSGKNPKQSEKKPKLRAKNMSDEELNNRIRRLELEKKYNKLKGEDYSDISNMVKKIADTTIMKIAIPILSSAGTYLLIDKMFGAKIPKSFDEYMIEKAIGSAKKD